jgi:predicted metal-dependent hydrolase
MPGKVVQFKTIGTVSFFQNRRSKNIKISVKPDKTVLVSFPFYCTSKEVLSFVQKNEEWIIHQQQKMEALKSRVNEESTINTKLHIVFFSTGESYFVETKNAVVTITVKEFDSDFSQNFIEDVLTQIYRVEAKKLLPTRLEELANKNNFRFQKVTIRNNKRNWGSCSSRNNISLNLQLMKLPDELIDYILLHELVHTEIKNHGPEFWKKLNEITNNNARQLAKQVKKYSTYTP